MAVVLNDFTWELNPRADGKLYMSPETRFDVFPTTSPSIFDNDTYITSQTAQWSVVDQDPLDGQFSFSQPGFRYAPGSQSGIAWFVYRVYNYDGLGNVRDSTVRITIR